MDASEIIRRNKQKAVYTNLLQQVNLQQNCVASNCSTSSECIFRFPTYETMENYYGGRQICDNCCPTTDTSTSASSGFAINFTTTLDLADNLYVVGGFVGQYNVFDINNNSPSLHNPPITLTNSGQGVYLIKYNSSGVVQWATQMNFTLNPLNPVVISAPFVTTDGVDIYVNGRCGSITDFYNATDGSTFKTPAAIGATINTSLSGLGNNLFIARYSGSSGTVTWVNQIVGAGPQFRPGGFILGESGMKYSPQIGSPAPILLALTARSTVSFYNSWSVGQNVSSPVISYQEYTYNNTLLRQSFVTYMTAAGTISTILQVYPVSTTATSYTSTNGIIGIDDVDQNSGGSLYLGGYLTNLSGNELYLNINRQSFANGVPTTSTSNIASTVLTTYQNVLLKFTGTSYNWIRSQVTEINGAGVGCMVKTLPGTTDVVVAGAISSSYVRLYNANAISLAPTNASISTSANFGRRYTYLYKYDTLGTAQWITQLGVVGAAIGGSAIGGNALCFLTADNSANIYMAGAFTTSTIPYSWSKLGGATGSPVSTNMPVIGNLGSDNSTFNGYIAKYSTNGNFLNFSKTNGSSLLSTIFTLNTGEITTTVQGGLAVSTSNVVYGVGGIIATADFYKFSSINYNTSFLTLSTNNIIAPYAVKYTIT
jgi:hypothetical protein